MLGVCMIDPGDKVLVENPTYLVALQSFHMFDPKIIPVQMTPTASTARSSLRPSRPTPSAKFIYVTPTSRPHRLSYTKESTTRWLRS